VGYFHVQSNLVSAIAHLTPEFFNVLTADHLNLITPESLSVLNLNQLPKEGSSVLDSSQVGRGVF